MVHSKRVSAHRRGSWLIPKGLRIVFENKGINMGCVPLPSLFSMPTECSPLRRGCAFRGNCPQGEKIGPGLRLSLPRSGSGGPSRAFEVVGNTPSARGFVRFPVFDLCQLYLPAIELNWSFGTFNGWKSLEKVLRPGTAMRSVELPLRLLDHADSLRRAVAPGLALTRKSALGQFMTPATVARFMAKLFPPSTLETCVLLDPGAGVGALSCAFLDRCAEGNSPDRFAMAPLRQDNL